MAGSASEESRRAEAAELSSAVIIYAQEALDDVDRLFTWLLDRNQTAAGRFLEALRHATARIAEAPELYPVSDTDAGARKCLMRFGGSAYVIHYVAEGDNQIIVRMWHGREERR
jgi:plasmid stabilization system protein ParE